MTKRKPTAARRPGTSAGAKARKSLRFVGRALVDYRELPDSIKETAGRLLLDIQYGDVPANIEPMSVIGDGAIELKVNDADGWFRVFYVAKFEEAVYVLHSFQKKTNKTSPKDISMGQQRYKLLIEERSRKP